MSKFWISGENGWEWFYAPHDWIAKHVKEPKGDE